MESMDSTARGDGEAELLDTARLTAAGRYQLRGVIGKGGMGLVYAAWDPELDRNVAIKVVRREGEATQQRLLREARAMARLHHPNVVTIHDVGMLGDDAVFVAMELIDGPPLNQWLVERTHPWQDIVRVFIQAGRGLAAAHDAGLVHRDFKPSNVHVSRDGQVQVLDFGLVLTEHDELAHDGDATAHPASVSSSSDPLTRTGAIMGTPAYMAPEQARSQDLDHRCDQFSFCVALWEALAGERPFEGRNVHALVGNLVGGRRRPFPASRRAALPDALIDALARGLELERDARWPDMHALLAELERVLAMPTSDRRVVSRRGWLLAGGALGLVAAGVAGFALIDRSPIQLGMSGALSGPAGAIGQQMRLGIEARLREANAARELDRELQLEVLDDGYEPDRARANVERLGATKLALVGNVGTPTTAASLQSILAARVPLIGAHSGAEHLRRDPPDRYVFNFRAGYALETAALVDRHLADARRKPTALAVLAQDDGYGESGIDGIRRALARHGFHEFEQLLVTRYAGNTMDVRAAVEAVRAREDIEVVVLVAAYRAAAQFVAGLADHRPALDFWGISPIGGEVFAEELRNLGRDPAGIVITQVVPHPGSSATGVLRYREALARSYPDAVPDFVSLEGYIVADLVIEALRRCERDYERERLVEALESFSDVDRGFGTPIGFSPSDHQGSDRVWATRIDGRGQLIEFVL